MKLFLKMYRGFCIHETTYYVLHEDWLLYSLHLLLCLARRLAVDLLTVPACRLTEYTLGMSCTLKLSPFSEVPRSPSVRVSDLRSLGELDEINVQITKH